MTHKQMSPPAATGGARKRSRLAAFERSESNPPNISIQALRRSSIARRFALSPAMAELVAELAFEAGGRT